MKAVVVAAMLMACAAATPEHQRMFADFKSTHGRTYATEEEELKRFRVFSDNMKRAEELNRANPLARFGSNVFADMTAAEFKSRHNFDASRVPKNDKAPITFGASAVRDATGQSIDWRTKGAVTPVKNQGECSSCWAFSTTGNIEGQWFLAGNPLTPLSEQELVSCDIYNSGCETGTMGGAIDWLVLLRNGQIVTEAAYPYKSGNSSPGNCSANLNNMPLGATVTGQRNIAPDENQMTAFVYSSGPLSVYVDSSSWQFYNGGIMTGCTAGIVDHAVLITGFNDNEGSWTIKNSWGTQWGEAGYIRVQKGTDQCHITKLPTTAIASTSPPTTTTTPPAPKGCAAVLPAAQFTFPQSYGGQNTTYDWLISLTGLSNDTPVGDVPCLTADGVYIGQYRRGDDDAVACITSTPTTAPIGRDGSCLYMYTQTVDGINRYYELPVMCDRQASSLTPPAVMDVIDATGFSGGLDYSGTFRSSLVC